MQEAGRKRDTQRLRARETWAEMGETRMGKRHKQGDQDGKETEKDTNREPNRHREQKRLQQDLSYNQHPCLHPPQRTESPPAPQSGPRNLRERAEH